MDRSHPGPGPGPDRESGPGPGQGPVTVAEAGEAAVLEILARESDRADGRPASGDPVGNGDDAAVLGPAAGTVVTTDMLVEGTHFRLDLTSWRDVGRRAVAQNVSDVLAMGADCSRLVVAVGLPGSTPLASVEALAEGIGDGALAAGARVVGGDLTAAPVVVVSVTAIGVLPEGADPVRIDGARPGDVVALTGHPGRSQAGLELLLAGHHVGPLQDVHRVPSVPVGLGTRARTAGATALTDVSDGLLRDLAGMARASGVAADLTTAALPEHPDLARAAATLSRDGSAVRDWMLDGGEDQGLLATFPAGVDVPEGFTVIGRVTDGPPGEIRVDGSPRTPGGWDSASSAGG